MLEGWSWEAGPKSDSRQPLSPQVQVCSSAYQATLFHAAALVTFFTALRVSELIISSRRDSSCWALVLSDIQLIAETVCLRVRKS